MDEEKPEDAARRAAETRTGSLQRSDASSAAHDDPAAVLRDAQDQFVRGFVGQCRSLSPPADPDAGRAWSVEDAVERLHRMAGLAGTVGFPRVSAGAAELEEALRTSSMTHVELRDRLAGLRLAFAEDVRNPDPPQPEPEAAAAPMTVLVVEDDPVQRIVISAQLRARGHAAVAVASGEEALAAARKALPDVILLDVELPGINGYAVCRMLKADPELARVPVVFLSARRALDDRLAGLSLGADDFLSKPIDSRELALRLQRLDRRGQCVDDRTAGGVLTYDGFHREASEALLRGRSALALIRTPADQAIDVAAVVRDEIRRRDLCGQYDRSHVVVLLPDTGGGAARDRLAVIVEKCRASGIRGVYAGVAASEAAGARSLDQLLEEADEAVAVARYENLDAALRPAEPREAPARRSAGPLVLVADDDPDVVRIVDAHLASAGYRRILTFDGSRTLEEIRAQHPDVLVLDLMMPRVTGFDVLAGLRDLGEARPRVIVLSARGREENVMRAFGLGADDFMLKPFNPRELLARIARLVK